MSDNRLEALNRNQREAQQHDAALVTLSQRLIDGQERNTAAVTSLRTTTKSLQTTVRNLATQTSIMNETLEGKSYPQPFMNGKERHDPLEITGFNGTAEVF